MTDYVGFNIIDVEFNDINGGSFSVTVSKSKENIKTSPLVQKILDVEHKKGLSTLVPFQEFAQRVIKLRLDLLTFINNALEKGKVVAALGASTKGNVILQYCELSEKEVNFVGEVNEEKYGCYTPGTFIPIISEDELIAKNPDYLIILPWHFKNFFATNKKFANMSLVFPLPKVEVVNLK